MRTAKDAFGEDDPAAYTELLRDVRALATKEYTDAEVELLHGFRFELNLMRKRAKKSMAETELTPFEITKLDTVVEKIINVQTAEFLTKDDSRPREHINNAEFLRLRGHYSCAREHMVHSLRRRLPKKA